jgi:hypothetical protein
MRTNESVAIYHSIRVDDSDQHHILQQAVCVFCPIVCPTMSLISIDGASWPTSSFKMLNDENPTAAHGQQQQQETTQSKCLMYRKPRKSKNRQKKTMATHPSSSSSEIPSSWEDVSQADSCKFPESDCCLPEEAEDQESSVLGSVDGQTLGPASPDNDGDHSPDPTESLPTMLAIGSAPSDDDSLIDEIYDDHDCPALPDDPSEVGSTADALI